MASYKLLIRPTTSEYSTSIGTSDVLRVQLDGGGGRYRRNLINSSRLVNVAWRVVGDRYDYLETFHATVSVEPSQYFRVDLILDNSVPAEYQARFIPNTWALTAIAGNLFTITAQMEVTPSVRDYEIDSIYIAVVEMFGFSPTWEYYEEIFNEIMADMMSIPHE